MHLTIADRVRSIIQDHVCSDLAVADDAHIVNDLGANSLDTIELVLALEEAFGIAIPDDDMASLGTVGEAVALVERLAVQG